jgi:hypothetical protein
MAKTTFHKSRQSSSTHRLYHLRESLINSVLASEPEAQRPPKKEKVFHGPNGYTKREAKVVVPDEIVLAIRFMRERHGATPKQLSEMFNLKVRQIESIIEYRTRAHLVPQQL